MSATTRQTAASAATAERLDGRRFAGSLRVAPVPRLALTIEEACAALGCSWDFWREHVAPEVRVVRRGRKKLVPVRELERWLEAHAEAVLG
jgi:excisionase family DNA binding protein